MKKNLLLAALLSISFTSLTMAATTDELNYDLIWPINDEKSVAIFKSLPVLPYEDSFHEGGTGYLDGVKPSDFPANVSAFAFEDWAGRTGIALRYVVEKTEAANDEDTCGLYYIKEPGKVYASTIFKRYSNRNQPWTIGEHYGAHVMVHSTLNLSNDTNEFSAYSLAELIAKGEIKLNHSGETCATIRLVPAVEPETQAEPKTQDEL